MRVPFARSKAPPAASPTGQPAPCANCAAPMAVGQDWCVACGTAVAGRFGRGPGLRSSLGVVGVTLLLVVGAVAAAYAALSSDSNEATTQTSASVPAQTPVTPDVAPPTVPPVTTPPTATTPVPVPVTPPPTTVPVAPKIPAVTPTPAPTAPVATTTTPKATTTPTKTTTTPTPSATSAKILLDTDAASVYNPYGLPTTSFGDPAKAIDGDSKTSWTYQLDPATGGKTLFGLAIDLKSRQAVKSLEIADTPGMTVEFYGATGEQPVSITDPGWVHLANRRHIKASTSVDLRTQGKSYRYLLVWITNAPAGTTSGTLGISELSVST